MPKRHWRWLFLGLALVCGSIAVLVATRREPKEPCSQINVGMTEAQVVALLGRPPDDSYRISPNACFVEAKEPFFYPGHGYVLIQAWNESYGTLYVRFQDGRVVATLYHKDTTSWFEKVIAWVRGIGP
jgi:hypothetical protein